MGCQNQLIGGTWVQSVLLRTKDIVDLVGLLPQLKPSNPICKLPQIQLSKSFQPNTSLLAHQMNSPVVELEAAKVPFHNWDLSTLNFLASLRKKIIHTPQEIWELLEIVNIVPTVWILWPLFEDTKHCPEITLRLL